MWPGVVFLVFFVGSIFAHPSYDLPDAVMHPHDGKIAARRSASREDTSEFWKSQAQESLAERLGRGFNTNVAKNVILFLGDGMSVPTLAASRIYQGQLNGETGEEGTLSFDNFPYSGFARTYCVDYQVPDSACTATAYLCGVKNNEGTIGVTANVTRGDCTTSLDAENRVTSVGRWSQIAGKRTGVVTTTTVTHASPAGVYAQVANRDWECDGDAVNADAAFCHDIAYQLVYGETGRNLNVVLGGGRTKFLGRSATDEYGNRGERVDEENLINSWVTQKRNEGFSPRYVSNREQLLSVEEDVDHLLGLFAPSHVPYHIESDPEVDPTLEEMTEAAIKVLSKGDNGYFLFVEGGKIDHAHHSTQGHIALDETVEFSKAIQKARDLTDPEETLIVVTSDHAHTMSFSGYPLRGNDILGIAGTGSDSLPYSTISYANGPGYRKEVEEKRPDLSDEDMSDPDFLYPALAPLGSETHGGDDVGVFSSGPWAHLLSGSMEQNVIPHVMAYASCVGEGITACDSD